MISVVTGGCGFIGSHIVDKLLKEGHKVRVIDNLSTGRLENLEHHKDNKNLEIFKEDIRDRESIEKIFEGVTYVFHMAALADIVPSIQMPTEYYTSNVLGTFNVVEVVRKYNIKKLVYAASSSCYGIAKSYPTKEGNEITGNLYTCPQCKTVSSPKYFDNAYGYCGDISFPSFVG